MEIHQTRNDCACIIQAALRGCKDRLEAPEYLRQILRDSRRSRDVTGSGLVDGGDALVFGTKFGVSRALCRAATIRRQLKLSQDSVAHQSKVCQVMKEGAAKTVADTKLKQAEKRVTALKNEVSLLDEVVEIQQTMLIKATRSRAIECEIEPLVLNMRLLESGESSLTPDETQANTRSEI